MFILLFFSYQHHCICQRIHAFSYLTIHVQCMIVCLTIQMRYLDNLVRDLSPISHLSLCIAALPPGWPLVVRCWIQWRKSPTGHSHPQPGQCPISLPSGRERCHDSWHWSQWLLRFWCVYVGHTWLCFVCALCCKRLHHHTQQNLCHPPC